MFAVAEKIPNKGLDIIAIFENFDDAIEWSREQRVRGRSVWVNKHEGSPVQREDDYRRRERREDYRYEDDYRRPEKRDNYKQRYDDDDRYYDKKKKKKSKMDRFSDIFDMVSENFQN
jgi:hypothetical protein